MLFPSVGGYVLKARKNAIVEYLDYQIPFTQKGSTKLFREHKPQRGHLNIYSDSQAAIKSIYSTSTNSRIIADCRRSLHEMASQFTICVIWVPGHRDIVGNSIADELARQGTIMPLSQEKRTLSCPWQLAS